jgi:hypothetical protein
VKKDVNQCFPPPQVTEDNKKEYVKLYVNYRWCRGIEQQFLSLQKGFNELIPQHLLKPFDERELELIIGKAKKNARFPKFAKLTLSIILNCRRHQQNRHN